MILDKNLIRRENQNRKNRNRLMLKNDYDKTKFRRFVYIHSKFFLLFTLLLSEYGNI